MTHLLVIDENADLTENIRELFEDTGARVSVLASADGLEALARTDPFDLVIVDVRLGASAGASLLPRLRAVSREAEVIVMTGSATVHSAMAAVRHGVFAYLSKPFDPSDLLRLADRALGQVALRRERTMLSRDLARSEALHRAVFDTVGSLIVGVDDQHRVQLWNACAAQTTRWRAAEVIGRDAGEVLLAAAHRPALREMTAAAAEGGVREARFPIQTRGGDERTVGWHARPLVLDTMSGAMVLLVGTDLTERLEAEQRAASAEAMAAMGRLTSALAHEIRNPLNAATLQLELLRRSARKSKHESIERRALVVADELERLTSMLDDFLGLARPKHFAMAGVAPESIVEAVYELHEPAARAAGIDFSVSVRGEVPDIHADASRLKQALINLVVNAFDAMADQSGGRVEIELGVEGEAVVLAVNDDGPGLPDGQRMLEPFETTKEGGTGLGLPIVKRIAQMHGGELTLGPRPSGGTRAAIVLPMERDPAQLMRGLT